MTLRLWADSITVDTPMFDVTFVTSTPQSIYLVLTEKFLATEVVMQQESYQPDYGPTEYDLDFNFDLDFSFSDYLIIGVYFVFILPILSLLSFAQSLFRKIKTTIVYKREPKEEQLRSPGLLSFFSKIF